MSDEMHDTHDDAKPVTHGIARRDALKAMAAAAMVPMLPEPAAAPMAPAARAPLPMLDEAQQAKRKGPRGTPSDPVLQVAKADWPNKLQARELEAQPGRSMMESFENQVGAGRRRGGRLIV